MTITLVFLLLVAAIAAWWLARNGIMTKPWLEVGLEAGAAGSTRHVKTSPIPAAKFGLGVFLAIVGALFALFLSAWSMRMAATDWWAPPLPKLLWFNTVALVAASALLHWVGIASRRGEKDVVWAGLLAAGGLTMAFLGGQILVWLQLSADGYLFTTNPANSFFYLITGLHGLHMLGGLAALGRTVDRAWRNGDRPRLLLSIQLCAAYWHFLLFVWLVLFAVLSGWAAGFIALCRSLV